MFNIMCIIVYIRYTQRTIIYKKKKEFKNRISKSHIKERTTVRVGDIKCITILLRIYTQFKGLHPNFVRIKRHQNK